jgi:hypothetical protein
MELLAELEDALSVAVSLGTQTAEATRFEQLAWRCGAELVAWFRSGVRG